MYEKYINDILKCSIIFDDNIFRSPDVVFLIGYIDYSCMPFNMISMGRHSDTISIASSFALPPPHDMLSITHLSDDPYSSGSNGVGTTQIGNNGYPMDLMSMVSSHISNGNGSNSSAMYDFYN